MLAFEYGGLLKLSSLLPPMHAVRDLCLQNRLAGPTAQAQLGPKGCRAVTAAVAAALTAAGGRWRRASLADPDTLHALALDLGNRLAPFRVEALASLVHHAPLA